jgi:hypothetical protein
MGYFCKKNGKTRKSAKKTEKTINSRREIPFKKGRGLKGPFAQ